ncbi:MAG: hypothetical protein WCH39_29840 [Schlesneria sp.]|jgi:ATP-dependent Clp protease ATP-binding subunit ClpB
MLANILERLTDRQKVRIEIPDSVRDELRGHCLKDLSNGGRGIGTGASLAEKDGVPTITLG